MTLRKVKLIYLLLIILFFFQTNCKKLLKWPPPLNSKPVARFNVSQQEDALKVFFDASGSYDDDGKINEYTWDFGDGTIGSGVSIFHTYAKAGTWLVELQVTDDDEEYSKLRLEIEVLGKNIPPKAAIRTNSLDGVEDFTFEWHFILSDSNDPDGFIKKYSIEIKRHEDDKRIFYIDTSDNVVIHYFKESDLADSLQTRFLIILTVEDNRGATSKAEKLITITSK